MGCVPAAGAQVAPARLPVATPFAPVPGRGDGVLAGGGGDYFDILAFHTYAYYDPQIYDWDTPEGGKWTGWGGVLAGKVSFLRQALAAYGYDKPLVLNETGLIWWPDEPASPEYRQAQAD